MLCCLLNKQKTNKQIRHKEICGPNHLFVLQDHQRPKILEAAKVATAVEGVVAQILVPDIRVIVPSRIRATLA